MATLAPNLDRARNAVWAAFPGTTVYWIGDAAHAAECSDHNPDARGIVHAIDVMLAAGTEQAAAVVRGAVGRADLQYVIHDRTIWSVSWGWQPQPYDGSNPHTDHVHISGRHGATGWSAGTCTGYDTAAEQDTTPWVFTLPMMVSRKGDDMPSGELLPGFGIDEANSWLPDANPQDGPVRAVAVPLPVVGTGSGQWGDAWLYLAGPGPATVRYGCFPSGQWHDVQVGLTQAAGPLPLPAGTTEVLIARKRTSATDTVDGVPVRWHVQYAAA